MNCIPAFEQPMQADTMTDGHPLDGSYYPEAYASSPGYAREEMLYCGNGNAGVHLVVLQISTPPSIQPGGPAHSMAVPLVY